MPYVKPFPSLPFRCYGESLRLLNSGAFERGSSGSSFPSSRWEETVSRFHLLNAVLDIEGRCIVLNVTPNIDIEIRDVSTSKRVQWVSSKCCECEDGYGEEYDKLAQECQYKASDNVMGFNARNNILKRRKQNFGLNGTKSYRRVPYISFISDITRIDG